MLNHIAIVTTLRCDLKCQHCLRGFPKQRPDFPVELLDKLLIEALPFGARHVALTGGEPGLHPHFEQIVEKIVSYGCSWHFVSNGQRTKPYLPLMERYKDQFRNVSLSLDGATAATHDKIRGRKGAFERVIGSAKEYIQAGYRVKFAAVLNRQNKDEMEGLVNLAMDLGASSIGFGGTIPTPWNQNLVLSDEESLHLWEQAAALREKLCFEVQTASALYTRGGVNFCGILNLRELAFNSRGEMIFCGDTMQHGVVIGPLAEQPLSALIQHWIEHSAALQCQRAKQIAEGNMGEGFDTCAFCNRFIMYQK